jgi:hypothetical protein
MAEAVDVDDAYVNQGVELQDYILSSAWVEDTMMCDYGGQSLREYNACARLESSRLSRERGFVPEAGSSPEFDESCLFKACGFR